MPGCLCAGALRRPCSCSLRMLEHCAASSGRTSPSAFLILRSDVTRRKRKLAEECMPRKKAMPGYGPLPGSMPAAASHLMGGPSSMLPSSMLPPSAFQLAPQPEPALFAPQEMRFSSSSEATPVSTPATDVQRRLHVGTQRACRGGNVAGWRQRWCATGGFII